MPQNIYQAVWIFIIYAFLGWCSEVAFAAVNKGKFVNRGFLNGPVCPIYGVGMLYSGALSLESSGQTAAAVFGLRFAYHRAGICNRLCA